MDVPSPTIIVLSVIAALALTIPLGSIVRVEEGHVGVYWRGGALLDQMDMPGFHTKMPFITSFANVQITLQTDVVRHIPCGTAGGVMLSFDKIEVVNMLDRNKAHETIKRYGVDYDKVWIFDRIHHEINQFCSSHTLQQVYIDQFDVLDEALASALQKSCDEWDTGIKIVSIRVTKPIIPDAVRANYEIIEKEKTRLMVQQEQEKNVRKEEEIKRTRETIHALKEAEVARTRASADADVAKINAAKEGDMARLNAEKLATVARINDEKELLQKETERKRRLIDDEIYLAHTKAVADATFYELTKRGAGNKELYTEEYLRYVLYTSMATAFANNTKFYFGDKIPTMFTPLMQPSAFPELTAQVPRVV